MRDRQIDRDTREREGMRYIKFFRMVSNHKYDAIRKN